MENKTAVITGASSGIGAELARVMVKNGYHVALVARRKELLEKLQQEIGLNKASILSLDITSENAENKFTELLKKLGKVDVIILNAGIGFKNQDMNTQQELDTIDINVRGFTCLATVAFRYFKQQKFGHIVGISSILALCSNPTTPSPAYNASKAYVSNYISGLRSRAEHENLNITVTDIKPGYVKTPMTENVTGMFWAAPVEKASEQLFNAIRNKRNHAYITKRWRLIAWIMKTCPKPIFNKIMASRFKWE